MRLTDKLGCATGLFAAFQLFASGPEVGRPAAPLRLEQVLQAPAGTTATWESLRSNVVVLDFWATWCGPCVESIPHWNEMADSFQGQSVKFLAITDENKDVVVRFLQKRAIHSWVGLEGLAATKQAYDIQGIPTTVIVNQAGIVVAVTHPALLRREDIQEVIKTGASSLPKRRDSSDEEKSSDEQRVPITKPLFEVSVRQSGPVPEGHGYNCWETSASAYKGQYAEVRSAIQALYHVRKSMVDCVCELPKEKYDFTVVLPDGNEADRDSVLSGLFRATFHLDVKRSNVERECYILAKTSTNAPGLNRPFPHRSGGGGQQLGGLNLDKATMSWTVSYLENWLGKPVLDETGDTNRYDIRLKWKLSPGEMLLSAMDRKVLRATMEPDRDFEQKLSAEQRKELAAIRGELRAEEMNSFPAEERENIRLLRAELAKPDHERFTPDPTAILSAVERQWGVKLSPARRTMPGLRVEAAK